MASAPPKVLSAVVVATQPTDADTPLLARLSADARRPLPATAFIVKIRLVELPAPTATGWALYAGDTRIPKYWEYPGGIYFKVLDQAFLAEHEGEPLRFSQNGTEFVNTGVTLPGPDSLRGATLSQAESRRLPTQVEVLSEDDSDRAGKPRAKPSKARATRARRPAARSRTRSRTKPKPKK